MRRLLDWTAPQQAGAPNCQLVSTTTTAGGVRQNSPQVSQPQRRAQQHSSGDMLRSSSATGGQPQHQQHHRLVASKSTASYQQQPPDERELQAFIKLLHEIKYYQASSSPLGSAVSSLDQREFMDKVAKTLPLFLNVFGQNLVPSSGGNTTTTNEDSHYHCHSSLSFLDTDLSRRAGGESSPTPRALSSPIPSRSPQIDKIPDILPFAFTMARLFVSEVRQRASDKHAEAASIAILKFLNMKQPQPIDGGEQSAQPKMDQLQQTPHDKIEHGWNLLLTLNALANSQNPQIVQLFCDVSLPSTLIKCLYLFFDLPLTIGLEESERNPSKGACQKENTLSSTRDLVSGPLIKAFTQLLVHLCSYHLAINELIKKDDLRLLIGIASSHCLPHNKTWRVAAFQALIAISKSMTDNFMYLEQNMCIQVYVENMHRINSLGLVSSEDFVDMIRVLVEFLYNLDANNRNQLSAVAPLINQFKSSRIFDLIEELLFKIDETITQELGSQSTSSNEADVTSRRISQQPSVSSEIGVSLDDYRRYSKHLVQSFAKMAKLNFGQGIMTKNTSLKPLATNRFDMLEQFKMPRPSARDCILNNETIQLLKMAWSKCKDSHITEAILDSTISLFNDDKYNYFIFESQQLLVYYITSSNFNQFHIRIKQKLFKFLEFVIIETNYIPCLELGTLGSIIKSKNSSDIDRILALRTLIACLRFNSKFSDIFREIGLLEVIIDLLIETIQHDKLSQVQEKLEILYLLLDASQYLLAGPNNLNCTQFNESGAARFVFNCLSKPKFFQIFVPPHSSSSDDTSGSTSYTSRNNTPTPTPFAKSHSQAHPVIQTSGHWTAEQGLTSRNQSRPSIKQMQKVAFTIIRQLILSCAGDEHLANLLGLLARNLDDLKAIEEQDNTKSDEKLHLDLTFLLSQEINLKIYILKSLMIILKENHRSRTLFRKVGGFIYVISAIVALEKALPPCDSLNEAELEVYNKWRKINPRRIWRLIKNSLMTIVMAMRGEPANARLFADDITSRFTKAIRGLGCFYQERLSLHPIDRIHVPQASNHAAYRSIFLSSSARDFSAVACDNLTPADACCQLFRFLYDMSLNMADGTVELERQLDEDSGLIAKERINSSDSKSMSFDQGSLSGGQECASIFKRRSHLQETTARLPSLDLNFVNLDRAILTYPCVILSMLDLIPSSPSEDLMIFVCTVIKTLFKHEGNQQLLCEAGIIGKLLDHNWRYAIMDKSHFMFGLTEFMLEKLTKQTITPRELKLFLRLGEPLRCRNLDEIDYDSVVSLRDSEDEPGKFKTQSNSPAKEKIPTARIELLVEMMNNERSKLDPPFVEFDMSRDGCSSIFMPSIAPINAKTLPPNASSFLNSTLDVHTTERNGILGGLGSVERSFPPTNGLTFSTWICVDSFPSRSPDASHNIRLLTIYRGSAATGKEYTCFRVQVSAIDRALTVSTQEVLLFENENRPSTQHDPDCFLRIWTPETLVEGKWHHIAISMNRCALKQSTIHVYIDGSLIHSQRICYISTQVGTPNSGPLVNVGPSSNICSAAAFVNAFIGPLPQLRQQVNTRWRQGPCHLIEEPLSSNFIAVIYSLGPDFIGNFQGSSKISDLIQFGSTKLDTKHSENEIRALVHQQSCVPSQSQRHAMPLARISSSSTALQVAHSQQQVNLGNNYFVPEDRILMSLDARATSFMTLSRMRRVYTRFDCRQVSRVLGLATNENSLPILLLHNTGVHLNGPSRGIGAITIGHNQVRCFIPSPTEQTLFYIGGSYVLLGFVSQAQSVHAFNASIQALVRALINNPRLQAQMENINGFQILTVMFWRKKHMLNSQVLELIFLLITGSSKRSAIDQRILAIRQVSALRDIICDSFDLWLQTEMFNSVLEFIHSLISSSSSEEQQHSKTSGQTRSSIRAKNLKCLRDMDLLPRLLRLLPRDPSKRSDPENSEMQQNKQDMTQTYDAKAVYLIRQTVFELLNRTPRQSDMLYFGQFLASLLPPDKEERSAQTVNLRNVLLKSLLQMITKNQQRGVNGAMQEELVRILGFDWFLLFISDNHLDDETIMLGFLNLMILLSNEELYTGFRNKTTPNGGWLKEPTFPTIDGKFNIQLLGMNAGVFFGLNGRRKSMCQEVLKAPPFFLLTNCLTNLVKMPRIYLMIFQTMMGRLHSLDASVFDTIGEFNKLNLDILCDSLIGDTHDKRRQSLATVSFKHLDLVVCLVYMIHEIMCVQTTSGGNCSDTKEKTAKDEPNDGQDFENFPTDIVRFFMYLYNNNSEFQFYCRRSEDLIDALGEALMVPEESNLDDSSIDSKMTARRMTLHSASREVMEFSRLIILDRMIEITEGSDLNSADKLQPFERFLDSLSPCMQAQNELVDMVLRQILLMIDSTSRQNSVTTIGGSQNIQQFQLLLSNSILIAQIVTDKIWAEEIFRDNLNGVSGTIDHLFCLAEQVFKFNELLPKNNPPHAFIMQRALNRLLLFALSRNCRHINDKIIMLDLLKKIYDNRTITILNHMHSPHSAEFFVCLTYCLLRVVDENSSSPCRRNQSARQSVGFQDHPTSLIERQFSGSSRGSCNDTPDSTALMLVSMARKVWDAIYQSKKGILSEAFDMSLALPAFTLDTSLDLIQLKPDINDCCEKYWNNMTEAEQKPKRSLQQQQQQRQGEQIPGTASAAVNMLSGRLTRVVNAASFVSRVVGATAGTMASNVGEKLTQNRINRREMSQRSPSDLTAGHVSGGQSNRGATSVASPQNQISLIGANQHDSFKHQGLSRAQIQMANRRHVSIIEDCMKSQLSHKKHKLALFKYLCDEWVDIEYEILLRERALFGPEYGSSLDKWCLDLTEGPRRMRKKMVDNTRSFYENYSVQPERGDSKNKSLRYRPPISFDSHKYYVKTLNMNQHLLDFDEKYTLATRDETSSQSIEEDKPELNSHSTIELSANETVNSFQKASPIRPVREVNSSIESIVSSQTTTSRLDETASSPGKPDQDVDQDDGDSTSFVDFSPEIEAETNSARDSENSDCLSVLRLLERNERISHMFRCSRVQGLDTYEGLLLFGREHFYLIDGFTLLKTREIKDIDSLPADAHDPIIPNSTPNLISHSKKTCAKFSYDSIVEVHKRRYLLQSIALEVFSSDGRNALIVFPRNIRNKVYTRFMSLATQITSNAQDSLAGQKSHVSVEGGSGLLSNLIGETSVTQRWVRGEISNFQYLMNLNTIAGRSYNDLMQYPIFPWILADYTSDNLDLTKQSSFRDLSRPVGAQTSERLDQFRRRYSDWDDTETPPYHYGTFYSSAMIVASYMVRMEPFTQHFLRLQGGHFDLADRMFHSICDSWMSASKHNMADIKELIPEFFYLPEFLINQNKFDLGFKQSGMKLNNVVLPPWAKGDAREFIRQHRCALESDYVSAHLHEWIDLIFGYKQQGQPAVDAVNVFHHLFYEGNVDIYNTDIDPIKKNAVIGFINNFGQVPKQLFKKPHPSRRTTGLNLSSTPSPIPLTPMLPTLSVATNANQRVITHHPQMLRLANTTFKDLRGPVGQIVQVDKNIVAVEQNKLLIPPEYCRYVAWGHADRSLRLGLYDSDKPIFVWEGSSNLAPSEVLCCTIPNSRTMITAGTESSITVWKIEKMRSFTPVINLYGHVEPVTCLASSQSYSLIVSGSRDRIAIVWDLNRFTFVRQLGGGAKDKLVHSGPISAIAINDSTGDIATCATSWLYLWSINGELIAKVDSFSVAVHHPMSMTSSVTSNLNQLHILSVCFSQLNEWDLDEVIVTGASDGSVAFWSMRYYQSPMTELEIEAAKVECKLKEEPTSASTGQKYQQEPQTPTQQPDKVLEETGINTDEQQNSRLDSQDDVPVGSNEPLTTNGPSGLPASEPIEIKRRQRTDTMNSEWVKLSGSSTSTADTVPILQATPTSPNDRLTSSEFFASNAESPGGNSGLEDEHQQQHHSLCPKDACERPTSSPVMSVESAPGEVVFSPFARDQTQAGCLGNILASGIASVSSVSVGGGSGLDLADDQSMSKNNLLFMANDPSLMRFSKSDNSLVESFVILGDAPDGGSGNVSVSTIASSNPGKEPDRVRPQSSAGAIRTTAVASEETKGKRGKFSGSREGGRRLRNAVKLQPNHCWHRELFLRMVLPRRQGKTIPAVVTSLTISKDHRTLYVGDASGRITSWTTA